MTGRQDDRQDDRQRILDEYTIDELMGFYTLSGSFLNTVKLSKFES